MMGHLPLLSAVLVMRKTVGVGAGNASLLSKSWLAYHGFCQEVWYDSNGKITITKDTAKEGKMEKMCIESDTYHMYYHHY